MAVWEIINSQKHLKGCIKNNLTQTLSRNDRINEEELINFKETARNDWKRVQSISYT